MKKDPRYFKTRLEECRHILADLYVQTGSEGFREARNILLGIWTEFDEDQIARGIDLTVKGNS